MNHARVLVLEDIAVRYDLRRSLAERVDISLNTATSAWDLQRQASSFEPDLLVFDHWMPDMLGDEFLGGLRDRAGSAKVPAIVTVSGAGKEAQERYRALGDVVFVDERLSVHDFQRLLLENLRLGHRQTTRVALLLPVQIEFSGRVVGGVTRDVSQQGLGVSCDVALPEQATVNVVVFDNEKSASPLGSSQAVVRHLAEQGEGYFAGLEFSSPSAEFLDKLTVRIKEGQKLGDMLGRIERLPSLPAVTARILEESLKEDCKLGEIADLVRSDPALSAYLLKMANSAAYHFSASVTTIQRAVSLMGLRTVRNAVLGFSIIRNLAADNRSQMAYELWRHSVACALACEELAPLFNVPADDAFTIGLLHDTGKFLLLSEFVRADNGYAGRQLLARWSLERESTLFGMSHAEIGAALLERWKVPDSICQVVAHHHIGYNHEIYPEFRAAAELLRAADALTYTAHLGTGNGINDGQKVLAAGVPAEQQERARKRIFHELGQLGELFGQYVEPMDLCAEIVERANLKLATELEESQSHLEILRRAYERNRQNLARLAQTEKFHSLGRIAAGLAHEINNPLGFAISNLQTLRDYCGQLPELARGEREQEIKEITADLPALISESLEGLQRIAGVVHMLRSFGGDGFEQREQTRLDQCVSEALELLHHLVAEGVEVVLQKSPLPECHLDVNAVVRALMEILQNALAAVGQRGRIVVSLWQEGEWQFCSVSDTGPGMELKDLRHAFEPFYSTMPLGQGRGLGLSVAYAIVSRHGGDITISSRPGEGTTVRVRLPASTESSTETH